MEININKDMCDKNIENFINTVYKKYYAWVSTTSTTSKLSEHETIKALCFTISYGQLECPQEYNGKTKIRRGKIDYVDDNFAIEIDDAGNINSIRKLIAARCEGKIPIWIIHSCRGRSCGTVRKQAKREKIPLAIFYKTGRYDLIL